MYINIILIAILFFYFLISGIYFPTNKDALETAIENGVKIWGTGLENLYKDLETNPRSGYNVSLIPEMDCDNLKTLYWRDGRELYE